MASHTAWFVIQSTGKTITMLLRHLFSNASILCFSSAVIVLNSQAERKTVKTKANNNLDFDFRQMALSLHMSLRVQQLPLFA